MAETPDFDVMGMLFPHVATTGRIHVRVAASYLAEQSAPAAGRWFWSYHVRIENDGDRSVQLLSRTGHKDGRGSEHESAGRGGWGDALIPPGAASTMSRMPLDPWRFDAWSYHMVDEEGVVRTSQSRFFHCSARSRPAFAATRNFPCHNGLFTTVGVNVEASPKRRVSCRASVATKLISATVALPAAQSPSHGSLEPR